MLLFVVSSLCSSVKPCPKRLASPHHFGFQKQFRNFCWAHRSKRRCPGQDSASFPLSEEMEKLMYETIDKLPGVLECSCNMIFSRIKDIKGLRL